MEEVDAISHSITSFSSITSQARGRQASQEAFLRPPGRPSSWPRPIVASCTRCQGPTARSGPWTPKDTYETHDTNAHHEALRSWSRGLLPLEAATEMLIRGGFAEPGRRWVKRDDESGGRL